MKEIEQIARVCHEANRAYCETLDDFSQMPWHGAPQCQQESAIKGVEFHQAHPEAGDAASHEEWMKTKTAEGGVYGTVKDPVAKTHPCIVPFSVLPKDQQFKDRLFRSICRAFLESV